MSTFVEFYRIGVFMEKFKDILRDLIIDDGNKSLRAISKLINVSAFQLGRFLKGSMPNIDNAIKISNYFKVSIDYLFGLVNINNFKNLGAKNMNVFVSRYETALKENGLTNNAFCKTSTISESSLRRWKHGEEPRMESLVEIADKLSTSIDYLIGRF